MTCFRILIVKTKVRLSLLKTQGFVCFVCVCLVLPFARLGFLKMLFFCLLISQALCPSKIAHRGTWFQAVGTPGLNRTQHSYDQPSGRRAGMQFAASSFCLGEGRGYGEKGQGHCRVCQRFISTQSRSTSSRHSFPKASLGIRRMWREVMW